MTLVTILKRLEYSRWSWVLANFWAISWFSSLQTVRKFWKHCAGFHDDEWFDDFS
jgi:hypothetical protein